MNKTVVMPNALPGALTLVGWLLIVAGVVGGAGTLAQPGGDMLTPALLVAGGLFFGLQQLALAAIVSRLARLGSP